MERLLVRFGFALAWMLTLAVLVSYRRVSIPRRLQEVLDAFLGPQPSTPHGCKLEALPAWHYVRLCNPHAPAPQQWKELEAALKSRFMRCQGWRQYWVPMSFVLALSALALAIGYGWAIDRLRLAGDQGFMHTAPDAVILALLGAYVWSLYELISRRNSRDLTPDELYAVAHRFVAAVPIGYAFSLLALTNVSPALAFAASAFPVRDAQRIMRQRTLKRLEIEMKDVPADAHLGTTIDGLSEETVVRLEELHIATAYDLGYADPVELALRTGFSVTHVLAWIDQCMLVVYLKPHREALLAAGLPCALDICEFFEQNCYDPATHTRKDWPNAPAVQKMADRLAMTAEQLVAAFQAVYWDPHVRFLDACWYADGDRPMLEVVGIPASVEGIPAPELVIAVSMAELEAAAAERAP